MLYENCYTLYFHPNFFHLERPKLPANYQEVTWDKLSDAVDAIHHRRSVNTSLEELYQVRCYCFHVIIYKVLIDADLISIT